MIDETLQEQAALYAMGLLEGAELQQFETALTANAELRREVDELLEAAAVWSLAAPEITPPAELKTRVLEAIHAESTPAQPLTTNAKTAGVIIRKPKRSWLETLLPWALAASFAIVCGILGYNHVAMQNALANHQRVAKLTQQGLEKQLADVGVNNQALQKEIAELRHQNLLAQIKISTMTAQLSDYQKSVAVVVWDEKKQTGVLKIDNMPLPRPDKDYQLWVIDPQHKLPVNAGVFKVDHDGVVTCSFEPDQHITKADKFAISVERKGGAPQHQGPIVLLSSN